MAEGSPLYPLLNEINAAAKGGAPLLAISMALTLPDICVSLASEDSKMNRGKRYREWCAANLPSEQFSFVTPDDLWSMRCGVLHSGRFGDMEHSVARVLFAMPNSAGTFQNCKLNDAYFYSLTEFCENFTDAVYRWFKANSEDPVVRNNLPRLMQYRMNGMAPYVVGIPVLG